MTCDYALLKTFFEDNLFVCFLYCYKQYKPVTAHLNLFIFYFFWMAFQKYVV